MKTIVIYNSKTGFTKKYAQWIADELNCEALSMKDSNGKLKEYDCIIFGGGIMAGRISGLDKIKQNKDISQKKIIVFATGATPVEATDIVEKFKTDNLTQEEQERIPFYFFQSGINFDDMSFVPKTMLKTMKKMLEKKENRTDEENGMLAMFQNSCDYCDKKYIEPLITYVKEMYK